MKKISFSFMLAFLLVLSLGPWNTAHANSLPAMKILTASQPAIDNALRAQMSMLQANDMTTVIVTLRQQADLAHIAGASRAARQQGVIRALQATANATQNRIKGLLNTRLAQGKVKGFASFWVFNGFSVTATADVINELAQQSDVLSISTDSLDIVPALGLAEPNIAATNAPALWNLGYYGQGIVVANMDSGVDVNHPDLSNRWRGGLNSWYDPYGQHPAVPTDLNGHGTQTMGVMVGGDAGSTTVGMAPGAQWIAVKIFNDAGSSTATAIHQGFQWLLDPDRNPSTADAPNVVNNSWTYANPGCYLDFEPDLQSLRAAGILPVFAAGNGGPYSNSSYSPSNNPSAFAVGATDNNGQIYAYSSRGPTTCGGSTGPFPELVAPGMSVRTTDLFGGYASPTGTSLAAPHVSGGLALLLSVYPNLSAVDQQYALINSAVDRGAAGPDNVYGYGRLDLIAAYNWLTANPTSTPAPTDTVTAVPTFTSTSLPTDTFTATPLPTFTSTLLPTDTFTATPLPTFTPTSLPTDTFTATPLPTFTPTSLPTNTFTATPLPTFTSTPLPTNTFTPTSISASFTHGGDLDRSSVLSGTKWNATVIILVHNNLEQVVANATVTGKWSNGASGTVTCTTNALGLCTVSKTGLGKTVNSVTFTITNVTKSGLTYKSTSNHDPDAESNGTKIVVLKP